MTALSDRSLRLALLGHVPDDDQRIVADMQDAIDHLVEAITHARKNLVVAVRVAGGDPTDHVTIKEIDAALAKAA